jgi:hypothetical protein
VALLSRTYDILTCLITLCSLFSTIQYFALNERTQILKSTLAKAAVDLIPFSAIFFLFYCTCAPRRMSYARVVFLHCIHVLVCSCARCEGARERWHKRARECFVSPRRVPSSCALLFHLTVAAATDTLASLLLHRRPGRTLLARPLD